MINIDMGMKVAGRVAFQKYKIDPSTGERVNTSEELEVDNIITQAGLDSINASSTNPQLGKHYLALGEGTQLEELSVTKMANIKTILDSNSGPSTETVLPAEEDKLTVPRLRTKTIKRQFSPPGEERTYTEVAIVSTNSTSSYTCYTYAVLKEWNDVTSSYDPVSITIAADEFLEITYKYQVSIMLYLPTVPVTGEGIPPGTEAVLYRKATVNWAKRAVFYFYSSEAEVSASGWGDQILNFWRTGGPTAFKWSMGGSSYHNLFVNKSKYPSFYNSPGHQALTSLPNSHFGGKDELFVDRGVLSAPPGSITQSEVYIVAVSASYFPCVLVFNQGIKLTKDDKLDLSVSINYTASNTTWTDPAAYV